MRAPSAAGDRKEGMVVMRDAAFIISVGRIKRSSPRSDNERTKFLASRANKINRVNRSGIADDIRPCRKHSVQPRLWVVKRCLTSGPVG